MARWLAVALAAVLSATVVGCGAEPTPVPSGSEPPGEEGRPAERESSGSERQGEAERPASAVPRSFVLSPLNGSKVSGRGEVALEGDRAAVMLEASGTVPSQPHPVRLWTKSGARCPSAAGRATGKRLRSTLGSKKLAAKPFPVSDARGAVSVRREVRAATMPTIVVLFGAAGKSGYKKALPVACGLTRAG